VATGLLKAPKYSFAVNFHDLGQIMKVKKRERERNFGDQRGKLHHQNLGSIFAKFL
jgi:hypothetical protein